MLFTQFVCLFTPLCGFHHSDYDIISILIFYPLKRINIPREKASSRLFSKRTHATKTRGWAPAYQNQSRPRRLAPRAALCVCACVCLKTLPTRVAFPRMPPRSRLGRRRDVMSQGGAVYLDESTGAFLQTEFIENSAEVRPPSPIARPSQIPQRARCPRLQAPARERF